MSWLHTVYWELPARRFRVKEVPGPCRGRAAGGGRAPVGMVVRVLRAQELLETTDLTIDESARESGFGHSVLLRHYFAKVLDTSPLSYRRTFRGHLAAAV